jgi:hypothetical protein
LRVTVNLPTFVSQFQPYSSSLLDTVGASPVHFWANDVAIRLADGLRAALDKTAGAKD